MSEQKRLDRPDREKIISIFGCSNCVALQECLTDKPMNFCTEKRDQLREILALIPDTEEVNNLIRKLFRDFAVEKVEAIKEAKCEEKDRILGAIENNFPELIPDSKKGQWKDFKQALTEGGK